MATVIDLMTRLPIEIWFLENPRASDVKLAEKIRQLVPANTLLLLDRGFEHFSFWLKLIEADIHAHYSFKKRSSNTNTPSIYQKLRPERQFSTFAEGVTKRLIK